MVVAVRLTCDVRVFGDVPMHDPAVVMAGLVRRVSVQVHEWRGQRLQAERHGTHEADVFHVATIVADAPCPVNPV